ncbi:HAD family hydrolase [Paenibacillus macerans]|uniref:HAD family hydrolase n=1 Tax=Paenibacillus macerans TaxID=44252 RepID=UPI00203A6A56|nr:HAD family hydrolase [Paenibacillus macerans]MCM3699430.1 HAD family hydrolase [Paenibacillus macerans]
MNLTGWANKEVPLAQLTVLGREFEIQTILFDKDGTLLDFVYTWGKWGELLLARFSAELKGRQLPDLPANLLEMWGMRYNEAGEFAGYDRNSPLSMGTVDDLLTLLAWEGYRHGLSWAEAWVLAETCRLAADAGLKQSRTARLIPGVLPFLEQCERSGIKLGIVTSDETSAAEEHLEWLGIRRFFSICLGADRVNRGKPFPDMVESACQQIAVDVARTAVIGDTDGDMQMARSAGAAAAIGLDAEGIAGKNGFPQADIVIASYDELAIRKGQ